MVRRIVLTQQQFQQMQQRQILLQQQRELQQQEQQNFFPNVYVPFIQLPNVSTSMNIPTKEVELNFVQSIREIFGRRF